MMRRRLRHTPLDGTMDSSELRELVLPQGFLIPLGAGINLGNVRTVLLVADHHGVIVELL